MKRAVALLGKDEVDDIVRSEGKIEVSKLWFLQTELGVCPVHMRFSSSVGSRKGPPDCNCRRRACVSATCVTAVRRLQVECEFCKEQYQFTEQEIMEVLGR